jgi:hypothetical protein
MNTISKKPVANVSIKPSYREDKKLIIGNLDMYDYYIVSPEQQATLLEEEDAILKRKHSYTY